MARKHPLDKPYHADAGNYPVPAALHTVPRANLIDRVADAKIATGFDDVLTDRLVDTQVYSGMIDPDERPAAIAAVAAFVEKQINPAIKHIITDPDPNHRIKQARGRNNGIKGQVKSVGQDPIYKAVKLLVAATFPDADEPRIIKFRRARIKNCLIHIANVQKVALRNI